MLRQARLEISRFPDNERAYVPGSTTTPSRRDTRIIAPRRVAFRNGNDVGTRDI